MKKFILFFVFALLFASCQITEEFNFNNDGSGVYKMHVDMSGMLSMLDEMKEQNDSVEKPRKFEKHDTIIYFSIFLEEYKDSIKNLSQEEKELLESLRDAKIQMKMDEEKREMWMDYVIPFQSVTDLNDINRKIAKLNEINKKKNAENQQNGLPDKFGNYKDYYTFDRKKFTRRVEVKKMEENQTKSDEEDSMEKLSQMFSYKVIYRFPNKIKSVSHKNATIGQDGKSVYLDIPADSLIKNPKYMEIEIEFH